MRSEAKELKISFCTTVMNRGHHLAQTLPRNLELCRNENVEFVILDYGDSDGIEGKTIKQWLQDKFPEEIKTGRIRYARTEQTEFHHSHAKNIAHRLAEGDVLVNLDADNVMGEGYASWLQHKFAEDTDLISRRNVTQYVLAKKLYHKEIDGTCGRIAISKDRFYQLHGYNEGMKGWGGEDEELEARALDLGLKKVPMRAEHYGEVYQHSNAERVRNLGEEATAISRRNLKNIEPRKWKILNQADTFLAASGIREANPYRGKVRSINAEGDFGCGEVMVLTKEGQEQWQILLPQPHPLWAESLHSSRVRQGFDWRNPSMDGRGV